MNEMKSCRILYVDDEGAYCRLFRRAMEDDDRFTVITAESGEEALRLMGKQPVDIVISDLLMPRMDGLTLLEEVKRRYPEVFVLILTGVDSAAQAVRAMKAGAYDYILKPLDMEMVRRQLEKILLHLQLLHDPARHAPEDGFTFRNMVGKDTVMFKLFEKIQQVAKSDATVLIIGESGTGKELIAEAIHAGSLRSARPFIRVNCASLTESLINSELFGHEKGAFTGATVRKRGLFEHASGGTIFLDEIGDIPIQTQVALLRVLEMGSFQRVGGAGTVTVDVRVICATNQDLVAAVREKSFREDLYYRINVVSLTAPALRDRVSDIPLLASFFLDLYNRKNGRHIAGLSDATLTLLRAYPWPGNVRQLANVMERAVIFCQGRQIMPYDLPEELHSMTAEDFSLTLHASSLASVEETLIRKILADKQWRLTQAADALGIARGTLYSKMEKYRINKP